MTVVEGHAAGRDALLEAIEAAAATTGATIQALDARYVVDRTHLERAVALAARATAREENVADDPGVEVLLYAAGRRQIDRALEMGVPAAGGAVVVVVAGGFGADDGDPGSAAIGSAADRVREALEPAETLGNATDESLVRAYFDIGDAELAAVDGGLADLVHERVALLVVDR